MNAPKTIVRERVGLSVDDVRFAAAIVGWIALARLLSAVVLPPSPWLAILLFAGLNAIRLESALRHAGAPR